MKLRARKRKFSKALFTKKNFTEWVKSQPDRKPICPSNYDCYSCPIATWLEDVTGQRHSVSIFGGIRGPDADHSLNGWAYSFVRRMDNDYLGEGKTITKARVLKVLEKVIENS